MDPQSLCMNLYPPKEEKPAPLIWKLRPWRVDQFLRSMQDKKQDI